jgi:hypothetical protein
VLGRYSCLQIDTGAGSGPAGVTDQSPAIVQTPQRLGVTHVTNQVFLVFRYNTILPRKHTQNMLACGTGCHMSIFVVIEQELDEKFEVIHYPQLVHYPP